MCYEWYNIKIKEYLLEVYDNASFLGCNVLFTIMICIDLSSCAKIDFTAKWPKIRYQLIYIVN